MKRYGMLGGVLVACLWATVGYGDPYAVVVREKTRAVPEWGKVVERLREKYDGRVFTYKADVWEVQDALRAYSPTYVCFVTEPLDAKPPFVEAVHRLTRALDDDPYGDAIWGIVTGYTPEDALKVVSIRGFRVRKVLAGTGAGWLPYVQEGIATSESEYGKMWVKRPDGTLVDTLSGPTDRTHFLMDQLNTRSFDMMITSGHGRDSEWQLHYPDPGEEGFFRSKYGQVYGEAHDGTRVDLHSDHPKIYFGLGNCYIGRIQYMNCMALAWIHSGGAYLYTGYIMLEGPDSYQLGGIPAYFFVQGHYTWPEAFYLNNQALLFDLENHTPGTNPPDRDGAALYGDPGLDVRVEPVRAPLYEKEITLRPGVERDTVTVRIRMNEEGTPGFNGKWGGRHPIVLLPFKADDVQIEHTDAYRTVVTENFALLYVWKQGDAPLREGETREVTFTMHRFEQTGIKQGSSSTPLHPKRFGLFQNHPNPFNTFTCIGYRLPRIAWTILDIYDVNGRLVQRLVDREQDAGDYALRWDGRDRYGREVGGGVYVYQLLADGDPVTARKMLVLR